MLLVYFVICFPEPGAKPETEARDPSFLSEQIFYESLNIHKTCSIDLHDRNEDVKYMLCESDT